MYKVFFNDSTIHITSGIKKSLNDNIVIKLNLSSYDAVNKIIKLIETTLNCNDYSLVNVDKKAAWKFFKSRFKKIPAAGGLVQNKEGKFLFIKRFGVWDLPKGKIEKNETPENAALREVEEECGINSLQIVKPLDSTWHIYRSPYHNPKKNLVLKQTKWFFMTYSGSETPVSQTEEKIEEVRWFDLSEIDLIYSNTYRSLQDFLRQNLPVI